MCAPISLEDRIGLPKLATFFLWGQNLGVSFRRVRPIHAKPCLMAARAIHLMDNGTAKKSSLGDLPFSLAIAMIARSPSSSCPCRDRRSRSIYYRSHPVNPLERGEFPQAPLSTVYDSIFQAPLMPGLFLARIEILLEPILVAGCESPTNSAFFTLRGSQKGRAYLPPRWFCPCPGFLHICHTALRIP